VSYFYLIEVEPQSPLDLFLQCKISRAIHEQGVRGYRDYYRVMADSVPQAVGKILINDRLLVHRHVDLMSCDLTDSKGKPNNSLT
jgi:hypothetical protein